MILAPTPLNEAERLAILRAFEILDTPPEPEYDDIVRLASHLCGTPIALVSLVDADRQWFKARVGLDATQTPRDISFCGHVVAAGELMIVPDAHADERFWDNPLVVGDPYIRFYAGAPLRFEDGTSAGVLCVVDREPRVLREEQVEALEALSRCVVRSMEMRKASRELAAAMDRVNVLKRYISACAWCKRVQVDDSSWQRLESYIRAQTGSEFSHGICPECAVTFMEELRAIA